MLVNNIFVFRPYADADRIYPIWSEDSTHYISTDIKIPKRVVDTGKSWHRNYYFSSRRKENAFIEKYYENRE